MAVRFPWGGWLPGVLFATLCLAGACPAGAQDPVCSLSTTTLAFGSVTVGASADRSFTVTNTGSGTLNGSISEACPEFTIVGGAGGFSPGAGQSRSPVTRNASVVPSIWR